MSTLVIQRGIGVVNTTVVDLVKYLTDLHEVECYYAHDDPDPILLESAVLDILDLPVAWATVNSDISITVSNATCTLDANTKDIYVTSYNDFGYSVVDVIQVNLTSFTQIELNGTPNNITVYIGDGASTYDAYPMFILSE